MDVHQLPSLENLRCFLAAAEHLNFRRASEEVHLTPAAFGQRIRQLEETLGQRLFERTTRTVNLTEAGVRLVPRARTALREAMRCREALQDGSLAPLRLTLGSRYELGLSWLVPSLLELPEELHYLDVDLYLGSGPDILERLQSGQLDCIVTSSPYVQQEWVSEFLHREEYVLVGAPSLLDERPLTCPEDAGHHTLLDVDETLPLSRYATSIVERPMEFKRIRLCGAGMAIKRFAIAGLGVGVLPLYMIEEEIAHGALRVIMPELILLSDSFRLIYRRDALFESATEQLAAYLRARPLN